jgi:hypothetical protein
VSGDPRPSPRRGDWVALIDGVRVSRTWMTRHTPRLLAAWCHAGSPDERRAVAVRILQIATKLGSEPDGDHESVAHPAWESIAERIDPRLVHGPDWSPLAAALDRAAAAGYDIVRRLPALAAAAPLPDRHPARELHWRLLDDCPAALRTRGASEGRAAAAGGRPDVHSPTGSPHIHGHTPPNETDGEASTRTWTTRGGDPP